MTSFAHGLPAVGRFQFAKGSETIKRGQANLINMLWLPDRWPEAEQEPNQVCLALDRCRGSITSASWCRTGAAELALAHRARVS